MPRTHKTTNSTRRRILTEAALLFRRHGYRGTSTRQIAEAVGIKQPSLFHHFPTSSRPHTDRPLQRRPRRLRSRPPGDRCPRSRPADVVRAGVLVSRLP
ncbi:TetR/AcrR family transcriptional regulator [Streptomyces sp. NPDC059679]|uniref:TetR/AcrR family transcriptional regulator n=1 Tax=Streptomyces sp. NPDC059679 TaxID=3346903 RepID=UPI00368CCA98